MKIKSILTTMLLALVLTLIFSLNNNNKYIIASNLTDDCPGIRVNASGPSPEFRVTLHKSDGTYDRERWTFLGEVCFSYAPAGTYSITVWDDDAQCNGGTITTYSGTGTHAVNISTSYCW